MAPPPMVGHQKKLLSIRNKIYERLKAKGEKADSMIP
jgi:hypothetical protein